MATAERSIVVGVFRDRAPAEKAVAELRKAGFSKEQLGLVVRHTPEEAAAGAPTGESPEVEVIGTVAGGVTGTIAGGVLGSLLSGLVAVVVPGLGPILAAGLMAILVTGGAITGALVGMGLAEEDARAYESAVRAGHTLVVVKADGRYSEAVAILTDYGAEDVERRAGQEAPRTSTSPR